MANAAPPSLHRVRPGPSLDLRNASPPSSRRRMANPLVVGGVLTAILAALAFAALYGGASDKVAALVVARSVPAGQALQAGDLREVEISRGPGLVVVPATQRGRLIGRRPATALIAGSLLNEAQLAPKRTLPAGQVVVAIPLKAGQFPPELAGGDEVIVVVTGTAVSLGRDASPASEVGGAVLARNARVVAVSAAAGAGGQTAVVSLVVEEGVAPDLVGAAGAGQVGLVLAPGT